MNKTNYDRQFQNILEEVQQYPTRPSLLLHACCAPCACWPLEELREVFKVTILYNNSNIWPEEEYTRRKEELERYVANLNRTVPSPILLKETPYDNVHYNEHLEPYGDLPERSKRCVICFRLRLEEAFQLAVQEHFDFVGSVMSISRQKDAQMLNTLGEQLEKEYPPIRFLYADFKKRDGLLKGEAMAKEFGLYRQDYCGCVYSYKTRHPE